MSAGISGLLGLLSQKMSYLNQKQAIIAENVANVDTPGYKQLQLQPFSFNDALTKAGAAGELRVTNPGHIIPASMAGVNAETVKSKGTAVKPSGNTVDLEQQMAEVSSTSVDYQLMTAVYRKMAGLFKLAVKTGNS